MPLWEDGGLWWAGGATWLRGLGEEGRWPPLEEVLRLGDLLSPLSCSLPPRTPWCPAGSCIGSWFPEAQPRH